MCVDNEPARFVLYLVSRWIESVENLECVSISQAENDRLVKWIGTNGKLGVLFPEKEQNIAHPNSHECVPKILIISKSEDELGWIRLDHSIARKTITQYDK